MAAATSIPFSPYFDCCRCFQQSRGRSQIRYRNGGNFALPPLSLLHPQQAKHTGCLRAAQHSASVCARYSKTPTVTWESWDKLVLKNESPVLVEFYASWCGPCQMVHRVIDEIATEYKGKLECYILNTDNDLMVAEDYDVKAVPVVLLFKNGRKCDCIVGTMPKEFYVAAVEKVLAS